MAQQLFNFQLEQFFVISINRVLDSIICFQNKISSMDFYKKIRDFLEQFLSTFHSLFHEYVQFEHRNSGIILYFSFAHSCKF